MHLVLSYNCCKNKDKDTSDIPPVVTSIGIPGVLLKGVPSGLSFYQCLGLIYPWSLDYQTLTYFLWSFWLLFFPFHLRKVSQSCWQFLHSFFIPSMICLLIKRTFRQRFLLFNFSFIFWLIVLFLNTRLFKKFTTGLKCVITLLKEWKYDRIKFLVNG